MKVAGVIAEFDPFHNGHAYFLRRVRELTSADFIVAVMSGDFTQRGNTAVMGKRLRARAAMKNGADIVIELPVQYSTASAEVFALGGVSVLNALGCVDCLCFGTENDDIEALSSAADILSRESDGFRESLDDNLRSGMSFPAARMKALRDTGCGGDMEELLCRPNNILAVEYIKALKSLDSMIKPLCIKRAAVDHDSSNTYGIYSSAKNIRQTLRLTGTFDSVERYLPENTLTFLRECFSVVFPLYDDDLSLLMKYRLLTESAYSLMKYADMNADLAKRMINKRHEFRDVSRFTELIKTRNLTYTRISRAMLHVLLDITRDDMKLYRDAGTTGYARVLGFNKEASALLDEINEKASVPVISRLSEHKKSPVYPFDKMLSGTLRASDIYISVIEDVYGTEVTPDLSNMAVCEDGFVIF